MKVVSCLLLCVSLYCAFQVNRCVRPYMVGTHVRRKKRKFRHIGVFFRLVVWYTQLDKSEFVERFPELSLFYRLSSPLDSEMICIFPYFCPCEESAREIREILCQSMQEKLPVASSLYLSIARYFIKKSCGIPFSFSCWVSVNIHCGTDIRVS